LYDDSLNYLSEERPYEMLLDKKISNLR